MNDARATEDELRAAYDAMNRELGLPTGPVDPREYLPRFATHLDVPQCVVVGARKYVDLAEERHLVSGRNPSGVAAACLYAAARDENAPVTQVEAANVADVTPVTLRSTYQNLQD